MNDIERQLRDAITDVMCQQRFIDGLTERQALEVALELADSWRDRLNELGEDDECPT